eukprot:CAMPEP_0202712394 /NCGR_PEP_ID=MMETSP1385-20130828/39665_1 /ASSEMBLY_ACC=CAM_ASM_000861 /TAXON_ID=933848 /ORGANISM="Elphidium margaritaceum" /LENGTH=52 /DNA_ID=CAMNT_0049372417 /DNA_START=843 /DNA_END=1001 /DNA_ORIENTATION=-
MTKFVAELREAEELLDTLLRLALCRTTLNVRKPDATAAANAVIASLTDSTSA